jgi:hypothetical protein
MRGCDDGDGGGEEAVEIPRTENSKKQSYWLSHKVQLKQYSWLWKQAYQITL